MIRKSESYLILVLLIIANALLIFNAGLNSQEYRISIRHWKKDAKAPLGFIMVDRRKGYINEDRIADYVILCTDGVNYLILVAEATGAIEWNYSLIESIPEKNIKEYLEKYHSGIQKLTIKIIKNGHFGIGIPNSEVFLEYRWNNEKKTYEKII